MQGELADLVPFFKILFQFRDSQVKVHQSLNVQLFIAGPALSRTRDPWSVVFALRTPDLAQNPHYIPPVYRLSK